jgi:hypothetical protein
MKRIRFLILFSTLTLSGLGACSDRGPTQPAAIVSLAGHWSGTVTSLQDSRSRGTEAVCVSESIAADVTQDGANVSGRILTSCVGSLDLTGTVEGDTLTGFLLGSSKAFTGGRVTAAVSSSRIQMTVGRSTKAEFIPVLSIELLR